MTLLAGQVHLWTQSLSIPEPQIQAFASCLSGDEIERARRFHFEIHRNRFIAARGRLRHILAAYLGRKPGDLVFTYGIYGKPALSGDAGNLAFNLSHSEDLAVYAILRNREIGIDVEQIREGPAEERIPEMFFSPSEVAALRALAPTQQVEAFYRCWTRKEAYVKARSEGLSIPLDSFDVSLRPQDPAVFLRGAKGYSMFSFRVEPDYIGAIVAEGKDLVVLMKE